MKKYLLFFILIFTAPIFAQEAHIVLEKAPINRNDMESIKRGAKFFATNCMVCHTLIYLRYNALAQEAGITYEKMPVNVKTWPFDVRPPDLSLEASARGVDWIYTYLHSFYTDTSRPTGTNNLLVPNSVMTAIVVPYQGRQMLAQDKNTYVSLSEQHEYDLLVLQQPGTMTPQQFDATIADVVNFLAYAAEPYRQQQERLGWWVIGFLLILFVLVYLLKKSYWKKLK